MKLCIELNCKMVYENWFQSCFFWNESDYSTFFRWFCFFVCVCLWNWTALRFFLPLYLSFLFWSCQIIDSSNVWICSAPLYPQINPINVFVLVSDANLKFDTVLFKSNLKYSKSVALPYTVIMFTVFPLGNIYLIVPPPTILLVGALFSIT